MPSAYINGYKPFDYKDFSGGLNLRDKADAVGDREAIDLLNVDFTERGAIRQRDGFDDFTPADLTNRVDSLSPFYNAAGLRQLVAGCGTRLDAISSVGGPSASLTGLGGGPWTFARFGDPIHEYLYAANGIDPVVRYDGAAFTSGAAIATVDGVAGKAMPKAGAVAVTASTPGATSGTNASNRMVATAFGTVTNGGPGGTQSTPSRVFFSNAGQPEVWETDGDASGSPVRGRNFIDLTPGDGERILAAVTWRELVFVFKETKFFVLWGEGTAPADGTPTFQVREVVNSIGLASAQAVSVGRDGVYFTNRRGVYRTNGGDPVLLSDVISPMWTQDTVAYFRSKPINLAQLGQARALWMMERFFLAVPTGSSGVNDRVLVYDTQHQWWSLYDVPASALAMFRAGAVPELHFGYSAGAQRVGAIHPGLTDDNGNVIDSRWRSGWGDYDASEVKTIRENRVWGTGAAIVSFSSDFNLNQRADLDTIFGAVGAQWNYRELTRRGGTYTELAGDFPLYSDLTGNSSQGPAIVDDALVRYAIRGIVLGTQFANSPSAPTWSVHRITRHMREVREPSVSAT